VYHRVYLPTMLYLSEIWAADLSSTQTDSLKALQRKYLLALTGAYTSTNKLKLMNLLGVLSIEKEIECQHLGREKDVEERKEIRDACIAKQMAGFDSFYLLPIKLETVGELRSKYSIWLLTGHGPFRTSRGNTSREKRCRLCGRGLETPDHLLVSCRELVSDRVENSILGASEFDKVARKIVKKLFSLNQR